MIASVWRVLALLIVMLIVLIPIAGESLIRKHLATDGANQENFISWALLNQTSGAWVGTPLLGLRFTMPRGRVIDVFATTKAYYRHEFDLMQTNPGDKLAAKTTSQYNSPFSPLMKKYVYDIVEYPWNSLDYCSTQEFYRIDIKIFDEQLKQFAICSKNIPPTLRTAFATLAGIRPGALETATLT
jgi:hypothetical protein